MCAFIKCSKYTYKKYAIKTHYICIYDGLYSAETFSTL